MTPIKDITHYRFDGSAFVPKSKFNNLLALSVIVSLSACLYFIQPSDQQTEQVESSVVVLTTEEPKLHPAVEYITKSNSKVSQEDAIKIVDSSIKWGTRFGIEPSLLLAIAKVESTYDKFAISPVGAFGILQVLPKWHIDKIKDAKQEVGTPEMFDIDANIYVGTQIIKNCKVKYKGNINQALKCYNGSVGMNTSYDKEVIHTQQKIKLHYT